MSAFGTQSTYFRRDAPLGSMGMAPSLLRARKRFQWRNMATAVLLTSFVIGVYTYSIGAVAQEDFSNIEALEQLERRRTHEEEEAANRAGVTLPSRRTGSSAAAIIKSTKSNSTGAPAEIKLQTKVLDLPSSWEDIQPVMAWWKSGLGARNASSWIPGAPDVEKVGRISDSSLPPNELPYRLV